MTDLTDAERRFLAERAEKRIRMLLAEYAPTEGLAKSGIVPVGR